jgi:hypothetical protein
MGYKLQLVNKLPRMTAESSSGPTIYDEYLTVVSSGASGDHEINVADAEAGDSITLPLSGTYEGDELEIYYNNTRLEDVVDYNWVGSGTRTQISLTFNAKTGDRIRFRVDRNA